MNQTELLEGTEAKEKEQISKAIQFSEKEFGKQKRISGKSTFEHCLETAMLLKELKADHETICAALLHHSKNTAELEKSFGKEIFGLAEEVERINQIVSKNFEKIESAELTKIILSIAKDIRALLVKLADRTDNSKTLKLLENEKKEKTARILLEIYAPICSKLGLKEWKNILADNAFKILKPEKFSELKQKIGLKKSEREKTLKEKAEKAKQVLKENNITAEVDYRAKNFYSIYQKMLKKNYSFEEIKDTDAIRIICNSREECYTALGIIHSNWKPKPNSFDDYIANPKPNGYQSLHTVTSFEGKQIEFQIRTREMHLAAEEGTAKHWAYKKIPKDKLFDSKLMIAKQLVEWHNSMKNQSELMSSLRMKYDEEKIFAITPKKDIIELPKGSTAIDFAYAVHTDLGNKIEKAKANGKIIPLSKELESGDEIEIITSQKQLPKTNWLNYCKTQKAKSKIRARLGIEAVQKKTSKKKQKIELLKKNNIKISKCCNPIPGDEIIGFKTTKRKTSIHRADCKEIEKIEKTSMLKMEWTEKTNSTHSIELLIKSQEKPGIMTMILNSLAKQKITMQSIEAKKRNNLIEYKITAKANNAAQANTAIENIQKQKDIIEAMRI